MSENDNGADKNDTNGGVGEENTIPNSDDGVAVGHSEESSFEPEEDEQAPSD